MNRRIIVFIFMLFSCLGFGQNVVEFDQVAGTPVDPSLLGELEDISQSIDSLLAPSADFDILLTSFYNLSTHTDSAFSADTWTRMLTEAESLSDNYLLLARQYDPETNKFKLLSHLSVDAKDHVCYFPAEAVDIRDYIDSIDVMLVQYYDNLVFNPENANDDVMIKIARLAKQKLARICCGDHLKSSTSACSADLDDDDLLSAKARKYAILGYIKEVICNDPGCEFQEPITPTHFLSSFSSSDFNNSRSSLWGQDADDLSILGCVHLYVPPGGDTLPLHYKPLISDSTRVLPAGQGHAYRSVKVYNFGRFEVVVGANVDLINELKDIESTIEVNLHEIIRFERSGGHVRDLTQKLDRLNYLTHDDFYSVDDEDLLSLVLFFVEDKINYTTAVLVWWKDDVNEIVSYAYTSISDKLPFFLDIQNGELESFLAYDWGSHQGAVLSQFLIDYNSVRPVLMAKYDFQSIPGVPYLVGESFYIFYNANYDIELNESTGFVEYKNESSKLTLGSFHPKQPILIPKVHSSLYQMDSGGVSGFIVPAIMLKVVDDEAFWNNVTEAALLAVDVGSLAFGGYGLFNAAAEVSKAVLIYQTISVSVETVSFAVSHTQVISNPTLRGRAILFFAALELGIGQSNPIEYNRMLDKGRDLLDDLAANTITANVPDEVIKGVKSVLGVQDLLRRIPDSPFKSWVSKLDNFDDSKIINHLHDLNDASLLRLSKLEDIPASTFDRLALDFDDLNLDLTRRFNEHPESVDSWKFVDDAYPQRPWCIPG